MSLTVEQKRDRQQNEKSYRQVTKQIHDCDRTVTRSRDQAKQMMNRHRDTRRWTLMKEKGTA